MKLPSVQHLYQGLITVIKRFPVQSIFILLATLSWGYYINISDYDDNINNQSLQDLLIKIVVICNLGLTLTLALDLLAEKRGFKTSKKWIMRLLSVFFCLLLFFLLNPTEYFSDAVKIALLAFAFHLFVAFSPFMDHGNVNGFWQFNKVLFLRFLTAALYSVALYAGLAIALVAIDGLFGVEIRWKVYVTVFAVIAAGFSPIFFLAGVPANFVQLEEDSTYPKGLKIFTQFVLIPLMTIYLAILLFYEVKIIAIWSLPKGLVSSLIIGYSVFGILSLLLIYPMKEKEGNSWIKLFSRFFYIMLFPLIALLLLAVWKRIGPYGITESRYILVVVALWLLGITCYFLISKKQNIKIIPISLAILSLLAVYGPQSASTVSKYSQLARLKKVFNSKKVEDLKEKPLIVRYLVSRHGLKTLQGFTNRDLKMVELNINSKKNLYRYSRNEAKVDSALSILKVKENGDYQREVQYTFVTSNGELVNIKGYDFLLALNGYESLTEQTFEGIKIKIEKIEDNKNIAINIDNKNVIKIDIVQAFDEMVILAKANKLKTSSKNNEYVLPENKLSFSKTIGKYEFTYLANRITGNDKRTESRYRWLNADGFLLIRKL
ncbi:DUF4153 domain-containing protein [Pedobacter frigidisoli]|uniref:DUF4153 domain-containing protein n=1 Tax=Pedobacter frigidisoli TaxID=2530455 RepID=A0A4R0P7D4_9SPHI|nr:DUF4153 domain-containing protein [Pedobacter frigidisoli]TCD12920.1 DUF4153 domain-containing protein [Pedobacter frigidisoli]